MKIKDEREVDKLRDQIIELEKTIHKIPNELLPYTVEILGREMNRRSKAMELSHRNKLKYRLS